MLVQADAFLANNTRIVSLAARDAVPVMYSVRDPVATGRLMSYGTINSDMYRQMSIYVGKVLNGVNPAAMPVLQPTKLGVGDQLENR